MKQDVGKWRTPETGWNTRAGRANLGTGPCPRDTPPTPRNNCRGSEGASQRFSWPGDNAGLADGENGHYMLETDLQWHSCLPWEASMGCPLELDPGTGCREREGTGDTAGKS